MWNHRRSSSHQLSINKAWLKRAPDHFAVWSRRIPSQTAQFPFYFSSYRETKFKAKRARNGCTSCFFIFIATKTALLDLLCYFKLTLTDLSRCSKSPGLAAWLSVELGHGGSLWSSFLNAKRGLAGAVFSQELRLRQASPDPVNHVQQLNKMRRTMMKAAPLLLCSAEPICFALGPTEGAPCGPGGPRSLSCVSPLSEEV